MNQFLHRFGSKVIGVLSGFDRLRFRGSNRRLSNPSGILGFLCWIKVLMKDFGAYAQATTNTLCSAIERQAIELGSPVIYLPSSDEDKELRALTEARQRDLHSGLIAVLSCVELCRSIEMRVNKQNGLLEPRVGERKCLHYYHYYLDPKFGLMYTRLQSWFPFTIHIGINGREWLAQQMKQANIAYVQVDNCFTAIGDFDKAQPLLDAQVHENWPIVLEALAARSNPLHGKLLAGDHPYYWSLEVSEWATDYLFRTPAELAAVYPSLVRHGMETMHSADVMRFLGHKVPATGRVHGNFEGEVLTDMQRRVEGTRVKYQAKTNSGKMYDKHGNLRLEATLNRVYDHKIYRTATGDEAGEKSYRKMRKGVVDVPARAQLSQEINERHASFLAAAADTESVGNLVEAISVPVQWRGRRARALNPLASGDVRLLEIVSTGDFMINGFRNRDIREAMHGTEELVAAAEKRRQSAAVTRQLRLLQAHDLIRKQAGSHRYHLTEKGQRTITAVLTVRRTDVAKLMENAA
jgi:hypothetical protein